MKRNNNVICNNYLTIKLEMAYMYIVRVHNMS